jgi:hypothetical protein
MSNEHHTVYGEASLPDGTTVTLLAGHVAAFSDMSCSPARHLGIARWLDGKFCGASACLSKEALTSLAAALTRAIALPWMVFKAETTKDGLVRLTGLNLWTGGEFYWVHERDSFDPKMYQTHLYNWTRATFDPEAYALLLSWGVTLP